MQLDRDQAIATAANVALDSISGAWTRLLLASSDSKDDLPILLAVAGTERYQMATRLSAAFYALTFNPSQAAIRSPPHRSSCSSRKRSKAPALPINRYAPPKSPASS